MPHKTRAANFTSQETASTERLAGTITLNLLLHGVELVVEVLQFARAVPLLNLHAVDGGHRSRLVGRLQAA
jgi:hypothetical protein